MIDIEKVQQYANERFKGDSPAYKILDIGYAFHIYKEPVQPGPGPTVVLKETGEVYSFSSNPDDYSVWGATSLDDFRDKIESRGYGSEPVTVIT